MFLQLLHGSIKLNNGFITGNSKEAVIFFERERDLRLSCEVTIFLHH